MTQVLIGALLLSVLHAVIPNHWIPLIAVGRTEKWSRAETLWATAITGVAHTLSTILIGILVGLFGYRLSSRYEWVTRLAAPLVLAALGIVYLVLEFKRSYHHHHPDHELDGDPVGEGTRKTKFAVLASLCAAMFLSPCIEIEAYYFTAGALGWLGIAIVSTLYLVVTVLGMVVLVYLGLRGVERLNWRFLEAHEKGIMGAALVLLGLAAYFIEI